MPELPEVETMRRGILATAGLRIKEVVLPACELKPLKVEPRLTTFRKRAVDRKISSISRLGKRVVMNLDSGDAIVFEPRMTGLVLLADPPNHEHLRFELQLRSRKIPRVLYWDRRGLGSVVLYTPAQLESLRTDKLGPDALQLCEGDLPQRLGDSRRAVKVALLDQTVVAGIGNIYASEILHLARVHPEARCDRVTRPQWRRILDANYEVLEEAVRKEGSTLSDGTYRNALNETGEYQNMHTVYDREGEHCVTCDRGVIRRIVQAQRSTFFCPRCQSKSR